MPAAQTNLHDLERRIQELEQSEQTLRKEKEILEQQLNSLTRRIDTENTPAFENLFDIDLIQRLQDQFAAATGVASIITKPDGTPHHQTEQFPSTV